MGTICPSSADLVPRSRLTLLARSLLGQNPRLPDFERAWLAQVVYTTTPSVSPFVVSAPGSKRIGTLQRKLEV
jgi:hypothetical protein